MQKMPPEVLGNIFTWCLPVSTEARRPDLKLAPLLLCRVCATWRQIALGLPRLWDALYLVADMRDIRSKDRMSSALRLWAACVKARPVSFSVNLVIGRRPLPLQNDPSDRCGSVVTEIFLLPLLNQLRSLDLCMHRLSNFHPLFKLGPLEFPSLQSLQLRFNSYNHERDAQGLVAFETSSHLRDLTLEVLPAAGGGLVYHDLSVFRFPWAQLTRLSLGYNVTMKSWLEIIRKCPNLQQCRVMLAYTYEDFVFPRKPPLLLSYLTDFTMVFKGYADPAVVQDLIFPSLKKLRIINSDAEESGFPARQPTQFYSQLSSLHTLILIQQDISLPDLIGLLQTTSLLVELELDCGFDYDAIMGSLIYTPNSRDVLVRRLERLTIHVQDDFRRVPAYFSPTMYVTMVKSRWHSEDCQPHISCLERVTLTLARHWQNVAEEVDVLLQPLVEGGLLASTSVITFTENPRIGIGYKLYPVDLWE